MRSVGDSVLRGGLEGVVNYYGGGMRVRVDWGARAGNGVCMGAAPTVCELDDDPLHLLMDEVPESLREQAEQAANGCPKAAITIERGWRSSPSTRAISRKSGRPWR